MDIESLRRITFLRALTDGELSAFAALLVDREAQPGEQIIEEGTVVTALYIVRSGIVHVRRLAQKREMLLGRLGPGSFFGEVNLFDPGGATASVYAMKDPVALALASYESLRGFMSANPATGYKIVSGMMAETSRRLRATSTRLVNSVYWATEDRGLGGA